MEISAVMRDADSKLWAEMRSGMEQAASDLGVELRFLIPSSESAEEQKDLIRKEMERGTDGIILTPVNNVYIEENVSFGEVPVVSLEEPLLGSWKTISPDNEQIGKQLAEFGVQEKKAAAVLLVSSYPKSEGMTQRIEAAEQVLNEAGIQTQLYKGDLPSPHEKDGGRNGSGTDYRPGQQSDFDGGGRIRLVGRPSANLWRGFLGRNYVVFGKRCAYGRSRLEQICGRLFGCGICGGGDSGERGPLG